jgi:hypothetical protein
VNEIKLTSFSKINLNLESVKSLKFIENNSNIKTLNFSNFKFKDKEIKMLTQCLTENNSITNLNFSFSNFTGPFLFLQKNILKEFSFLNVWKELSESNLDDLLLNLRSNFSLTKLDFSNDKHGKLEFNPKIQEFIDLMGENNGNVNHLKLNYLYQTKKMYEFNKFLENPNIQELELNRSFSPENLIYFLNRNTSLKSLNISDNFMGTYFKDDIQISNSSIQILNFSGEGKFVITLLGSNFDFSKNFKSLKSILSISTLIELDIRDNKLGENGLKYLCEFLQDNKTLNVLSFSGNEIENNF